MKIATLPDEMLVAAFMAKIPDHVYFKDRESRFVSVSLSLAKSLGRTVEEVLGKTDFDFFDESLARGYRERELKIMSTGEALVDHVVKVTIALFVQIIQVVIAPLQHLLCRRGSLGFIASYYMEMLGRSLGAFALG